MWASLRSLRPEIEAIAAGRLTGSEREAQILQLLAQIVAAELTYRAGEAGP